MHRQKFITISIHMTLPCNIRANSFIHDLVLLAESWSYFARRWERIDNFQYHHKRRLEYKVASSEEKKNNHHKAGYLVEIFATAFTIATEIHMGKETA